MIHATAIIEDGAKLGVNVHVGPYCILGKNVSVGDNCILDSHVVISGNTNIGASNHFFPFASIGFAPQDLKYKGEPTKVILGDNNIFREYVTVNSGTASGKGVTTIGNNNMFMACSHVAHDCVVHSNIVMANSAALAGHVEVEDYVVLGGYTGVTQFNRVGKHAFIGAHSLIRADFPPYFTGKGLDDFKVQSVNSVGLQRRGYDEDTIRKIKNSFKILYKKKDITLEDGIGSIEADYGNNDAIKYLLNFIRISKNGIVR